MLKIKTTAGRIAAVYSAAAVKDVRWFLNGAHFERGSLDRLIMVATDGHRLITVSHDEDKFESFEGDGRDSVILSFADDTLHDLRKVSHREAIVEIDVEPTGAVVKLGDRTSKVNVIDGQFPKWRNVIPKAVDLEKTERAAFDGRYLAEMAKAATLLTGAKNPPLEVVASGSNPACFRIQGVEEFFALVMPMQRENEFSLPAWAA